MIWWVAYQRGSFNLKERYPCGHRARERCLRLFTQAQYLRVIADDDIEGLASLAHCLELPPASPEVLEPFWIVGNHSPYVMAGLDPATHLFNGRGSHDTVLTSLPKH